MPLFQYLKRKWIRSRPFPARWQHMLREQVPVYRHLPELMQATLRRRMQVFLDEKIFEGCGGLTITEEMRVVITAHA